MPAEELLAVISNLLNHFHCSIGDIADMTDFQIFNLYFHPRDDQGRITTYKNESGYEVNGPVDEAKELEALDVAANFAGWSAEYTGSLRDQLKAKWAKLHAQGVEQLCPASTP
jgi:hypothetical protein